MAAYVGTHGVAVFLALAPLLPMVGVALAYGPTADPAYEIAAATPYSGVRLLALRTAFVVATHARARPPSPALLLPGRRCSPSPGCCRPWR